MCGSKPGRGSPSMTQASRPPTCSVSHQLEVVGVGNFAHELAAIFALFDFFLLAFLAILLRFVLALVDDLLDLLFFFGRLFGIERLVIFFDQPLHLLAIDLENFVGFHFGRFGFSLAVQIVLDLAIDVGVVALVLVVLDVLVRDHTKQLPHLFLRELAVGSGRKIECGVLAPERCRLAVQTAACCRAATGGLVAAGVRGRPAGRSGSSEHEESKREESNHHDVILRP